MNLHDTLRIALAAAAALAALSGTARAQNLNPANTTVSNGTITVTNTFQTALGGENGSREGCTLQNQGTHTMYVFFGPIGSATIAKSLQVPPGQPIYCGAPYTVVLQDPVNITGTAGDAFVVNSQ